MIPNIWNSRQWIVPIDKSPSDQIFETRS